MRTGDIVVSIAGHDMGEWYVVESTLGDYVFLVDGKYRLLENPKQKKIKHVLKTNFHAKEIASKLASRQKIYDAEVRKTLNFFKNKLEENVCQKKM